MAYLVESETPKSSLAARKTVVRSRNHVLQKSLFARSGTSIPLKTLSFPGTMTGFTLISNATAPAIRPLRRHGRKLVPRSKVRSFAHSSAQVAWLHGPKACSGRNMRPIYAGAKRGESQQRSGSCHQHRE